MRIRSHLLPALAGLAILGSLGLGSCSRESETVPAAVPLSTLTWPAIEGAQRYTVRLWSGYRLLLEESSSDTLLVLGEHFARSLAELDSLELEVVGLAFEDETERPTGQLRVDLLP